MTTLVLLKRENIEIKPFIEGSLEITSQVEIVGYWPPARFGPDAQDFYMWVRCTSNEPNARGPLLWRVRLPVEYKQMEKATFTYVVAKDESVQVIGFQEIAGEKRTFIGECV